MDTKLDAKIVKGPGIKDMADSLTRKFLWRGTHEMYLVQCVVFMTDSYTVLNVLINSLKRIDEENWMFTGRVIQTDENRHSTWLLCDGQYSIKDRSGWVKVGNPEPEN